MFQIDFLDCERIPVPTPLLSAISDYNRRARADAADLGTPLESLEGQAFLAESVAIHWPGLTDLIGDVSARIDAGSGAVVLRNLNFDNLGAEIRESLVLAVTGTLGVPTDHVGDRRVLWPVVDRPAENGRQRTFSQSVGEAPLHTDSAFSAVPEHYNALYCTVPAACGGGLTRLVNAHHLVHDLDATAEGRRCIELLRGLRFPLRVPDAFYCGTRLITAPVLGEAPFIRFRHDCIEHGFAIRPDLDTPDHRWAFGHFREAAERHRSQVLYRLRRGEMILFSNHELLHGRTDYTDPARHLTRVRMRRRTAAAVRPVRVA